MQKGVENMNVVKQNVRGILLCLLLAVPAWLLGKWIPVVGGPVFAILAGMLLTLFLKDKTRWQPGVNFTSKKLLQAAVVLLGFGLNLKVVLETGRKSLPIILSTITTSLASRPRRVLARVMPNDSGLRARETKGRFRGDTARSTRR